MSYRFLFSIENDKKIAAVFGIEISPDIVFMVSVDDCHYTCIDDRLMSDK